MSATSIDKVRELNDSFRQTFVGGVVLLTAGVHAIDEASRKAILEKVRNFSNFEEGNDPYREHDFGGFDHQGDRILWKIDYYDRPMKHSSPDPANPALTTRVLTVMLGSEY